MNNFCDYFFHKNTITMFRVQAFVHVGPFGLNYILSPPCHQLLNRNSNDIDALILPLYTTALFGSSFQKRQSVQVSAEQTLRLRHGEGQDIFTIDRRSVRNCVPSRRSGSLLRLLWWFRSQRYPGRPSRTRSRGLHFQGPSPLDCKFIFAHHMFDRMSLWNK